MPQPQDRRTFLAATGITVASVVTPRLCPPIEPLDNGAYCWDLHVADLQLIEQYRQCSARQETLAKWAGRVSR